MWGSEESLDTTAMPVRRIEVFPVESRGSSIVSSKETPV